MATVSAPKTTLFKPVINPADYPIDYIGPHDEFQYIYRRKFHYYPGNVIDRKGFLKFIEINQKTFPIPEHLWTEEDREYHKEMMKKKIGLSSEGIKQKLYCIACVLCIIFLSTVAVKCKASL